MELLLARFANEYFFAGNACFQTWSLGDGGFNHNRYWRRDADAAIHTIDVYLFFYYHTHWHSDVSSCQSFSRVDTRVDHGADKNKKPAEGFRNLYCSAVIKLHN